ncbi:uncharacterized protein [Spinacia oleracea]|uniref:DUF4005 domain-containing protein n=1 Tax=Spinacia oleracea TaxID=3562 RepID=A0ABM3R7H2_SPIOL|nr:uncharacterized protein LOC130467154 [Spinacia oleracea]
MKRPTHVQPPHRIKIPGNCSVDASLSGWSLGSDPTTPVVTDYQDFVAGTYIGVQEVNSVSPPNQVSAPNTVQFGSIKSTTSNLVSKKRKKPLSFTRARSYDTKSYFGYSTSSWSQKRYKSADDITALVASTQLNLPNLSTSFIERGKKRVHDVGTVSPSKKSKNKFSLAALNAEAMPSSNK